MLQSTSIHRFNEARATQTQFLYQGRVENLNLDGRLEDVICQRLDAINADQTATILRDASQLKSLFTEPAAKAALAEADKEHFADLSLDLGQGLARYNVTKMPSGHFRIVHQDDPGYDVHAQVILMEAGEHAHHAILSTRIPGNGEQPELMQTVKMSFTGSQKFVVDSEEIHVGNTRQDTKAPHIPAWDRNSNFAHVNPFR